MADGRLSSIPKTVTKEFLRQFKPDDLVDVKVTRSKWTGPHKRIDYETKHGAPPSACIVVELGKHRFERWLIVGDQQIIRHHTPKE